MATEGKRNIVVAVDDSTHSERAFHWFLDNIHHAEDNVIICYCVHDSSHKHSHKKDMKQEEWQKLHDELEGSAKAFREKYEAKLAGANVCGSISVRGGSAGEEIIKESEAQNACMVVVGSRGMGTVRRTILGSVSDYVLHHSHAPVTIVPPL